MAWQACKKELGTGNTLWAGFTVALYDDQGRALAGFGFFHPAAASYIYYLMLLGKKR
jgi:hypothetical protein